MKAPNLSIQTTPTDVGVRYRTARDEAGLSRAQVAKLSNVSAKAIEKFEAGQQQPSLLRFAALCEAIGKSVEEILNGEIPPKDMAADQSLSPRSSQHLLSIPETPMEQARNLLVELDECRASRFRNAQRRAVAITGQIVSQLRFLEPDELVELAQERGVFAGDLPAVHELEKALVDDLERGQELCGSLEQRITDTALLGADVFAIELEALDSLAKRLELDRPMFGWTDHDDFARRALPDLRTRVLTGRGEDIGNEKTFPPRI